MKAVVQNCAGEEDGAASKIAPIFSFPGNFPPALEDVKGAMSREMCRVSALILPRRSQKTLFFSQYARAGLIRDKPRVNINEVNSLFSFQIKSLLEEMQRKETKWSSSLTKLQDTVKILERENQHLHEENHRVKVKTATSKVSLGVRLSSYFGPS